MTSLGSISSGTLVQSDLIDAFVDALAAAVSTVQHDALLAAARLWLDAAEPIGDEAIWAHDEAGSELVAELIDALTEHAPAYCYFGAHEGDGADFGFWPCVEQINELPQVEGSDEARELGEDCRSVNDHGNVTVYNGDGSTILDLV